jgi:polysaccharide biosynthesis transport protein
MMGERAEEARLDLRHLLTIARRRWWVVIVCMCVAGGAAYGFSVTQQKEYTANASLLLRDTGLEQALLTTSVAPPTVDPTRQAATNVQVVSSPTVSVRTASALRLPLSKVTNEVSVSAQGQTNVVAVSATDRSPRAAAELANTYAQQAVAFSRDTDRAQMLQAQTAIQGQLNAMSPQQRKSSYAQLLVTRGQELQTLAAADTGGAQVIALARTPTSPSSPNTKRNVALGLLLGLLLGLAATALAERWSRRIRTADELGEIHGLPVLTEITQSRTLNHRNRSDAVTGEEREAFRMLLGRLRYSSDGREARSVVVTSAAAGEGKSTVAWRLAETAALPGSAPVVLVETDMREPVLAARHRLQVSPGLADVLQGHVPAKSAVQRVELGEGVNGARRAGSLDVIVAGLPPANPTSLIEAPEMKKLLSYLTKVYQLVVLDTVPALLAADAMPLIRMVGGVLIVSRVGITTRDQAVMLRDELRALHAPMVGVVANGVKHRSGPRRGYYYYGHAVPDTDRVVPPVGLGVANGSSRDTDTAKLYDAPTHR